MELLEFVSVNNWEIAAGIMATNIVSIRSSGADWESQLIRAYLADRIFENPDLSLDGLEPVIAECVKRHLDGKPLRWEEIDIEDHRFENKLKALKLMVEGA